MIRFRDCIHMLHEIGLTGRNRLIVHTSPSPPHGLQGGFETLLAALLDTSESIITPCFTPQAMIIPEIGPEDNAVQYGLHHTSNRQAEFFHLQLSSSAFLEPFAGVVRRHPDSIRSDHPLLSFCGIHSEDLLDGQSLTSPLEPIRALADEDGDILLVGCDHTSNISIHYAEQIAGRRAFTRWALTSAGAVTCPGHPGCSSGFNALRPRLDSVVRTTSLGSTMVSLIPLRDLIQAVVAWLHVEPSALLCIDPDCPFCATIRASHHANSKR